MSWTKASVNGFLVATEALTLPNGAATDVNSSSIDFIPKGADFTIFANTAATNTTAQGDVDVEGSFDGSTWSKLKADAVVDYDTATKAYFYDVSTLGAAPYYRLVVTSDGNQAAESFTVKVVTYN